MKLFILFTQSKHHDWRHSTILRISLLSRKPHPYNEIITKMLTFGMHWYIIHHNWFTLYSILLHHVVFVFINLTVFCFLHSCFLKRCNIYIFFVIIWGQIWSIRLKVKHFHTHYEECSIKLKKLHAM